MVLARSKAPLCPIPCDLYCKNIMIVNDRSRVVRTTIVGDAPNCGVNYDHHSDASRGVIYAPRVINYAPRVINYAPRVINYAPRVINYAPRVIIYAPRVSINAPRVINYAPREHL